MTPTTKELIKQEVIDQLVWDDSVNANNIRVKVESENTVVLEGYVGSFSEKISAGEDASRALGITHVNNDLEIKHPEGLIIPDDDEIEQNVIDSLMWNSKIISTDIKAESKNRVVTLTGKVATFWEKYEAEDVAKNIYGVLDVINLLEVQLTKTVIDLDIENDIKMALRRNILIDEEKIHVEAHNGVVRLTGTVPNYITKKEAINLATYTKGVVNVIDDLTIGG